MVIFLPLFLISLFHRRSTLLFLILILRIKVKKTFQNIFRKIKILKLITSLEDIRRVMEQQW